MMKKQDLKGKRDVKNERGATLVEYALLVALVALVAVVGVRNLGNNINAAVQGAADTVANPAN